MANVRLREGFLFFMLPGKERYNQIFFFKDYISNIEKHKSNKVQVKNKTKIWCLHCLFKTDFIILHFLLVHQRRNLSL